MAITGRKPKPEAQRRNRTKPVHDWVEVEDVAFVGGPRLPKYPVDGLTWPRWTRTWWATISAMPHCILWTESDWQFAVESAVVAAEFHRGVMRVAKELRDRERTMGLTVADRRDNRIRYVPEKPPEEEDAASVTSIADYRASLE